MLRMLRRGVREGMGKDERIRVCSNKGGPSLYQHVNT